MFVFIAILGFTTTEGVPISAVFKALALAMLCYAPFAYFLHVWVRERLWSDLEKVISGENKPSVRESKQLIRLPYHKTVIDTIMWVSGAFSMPLALHVCGADDNVCDNIQSVMLWMTPLSMLVELLAVYEANRPFESAVAIDSALPDPFYLSSVRRMAILFSAVVYSLILLIGWLWSLVRDIKDVSHLHTTVSQVPLVLLFCASFLGAVFALFYLRMRKQHLSPTGNRCPSCNNIISSGHSVCPYDGTLLSFPSSESSLSHKYEFLEQVGRGGMGTVYKARHIMLGQLVAIKVLNTKFSAPLDAERFQREAKATTMLDSQNIVKVYDFGWLPDGKCYFAMEYLEGETLADWLIRDGPLNLWNWFQFAKQIVYALSEVHRHNIVHRDLKPSNIILATKGDGRFVVKLIDFGVAKMQDAPTLTGTGEVLGTPFYMSPEQCSGLPLNERSDIYSLSCLLYEALLGMPPIIGDSSLQTIFKHVNEIPASPSIVCPDLPLPAEFDALFKKGLAKLPSARFDSVSNLLTALELIEDEALNTMPSALLFKVKDRLP